MNSPIYKLRYKPIAYVFLLSLFLQSCSSVCNQLIPQKKPKLKQTTNLLTRTRTGLVLESSFQRTLLSQLPPDYELGTAYGEGDCFFDALAQSLNKINQTDINTDKHLRMLCHKFYQGNKRLVANWDLKDSREKGVSKERYDQHEYYYSKIQYTADECDRLFNQDICIWGRPWVEGVMLCRKLQLKGICSIEVFKDPETGNPVISYHLVKQAGYQSSISEEDGWALINKGDIPVLVNVQNELHFVPLWEKNPFLKDQRSQINLEINQEVCLSKEVKNLKKAKLRNSKKQYGARQRRSQREYLNSFYEQINAKQPINCQQFDLQHKDFSELDLRKADFSEANLTGTNFSSSNLQGAKFIGTQLQKAKFCYADLTGIDFTHAHLDGAEFKGARLQDVKGIDVQLSKKILLAAKDQVDTLPKGKQDIQEKEVMRPVLVIEQGGLDLVRWWEKDK